MNQSYRWLLPALLLPLAGCWGTTPTTTSSEKSAAQWIDAGDLALEKGQYDDALAAFENAADKDSTSAVALQRRGKVLLLQNKFAQAVSDCNTAIGLDPNLADAYYTRARAEKEQHDAKKSIEDFSKAVELSPDRPDYLLARGMSSRQLALESTADQAANLRDAAAKDVERALKLAPHDIACLLGRADLRLDSGNFQGSMDDADAALAVDSKSAPALVLRARARIENGEFQKAIDDCDAAIQIEPDRLDGYVVRAKARVEKSSEMRTLPDLDDCDKAADDLQKAVSVLPLVQGASASEKNPAVAASPTNADAVRQAKRWLAVVHELRGILYDGLQCDKKAFNEYTAALSVYTATLSVDRDTVDALVRRALNRAGSEEFGAALEDCNRAIRIDSSRAEGYYGRGMVYSIQRQYPQAIKDLKEAIIRNRGYVKAYNALANVYYNMATLEAANFKNAKTPAERADAVEKRKEYLENTRQQASAAIGANSHSAIAYLNRGRAVGSLALIGPANASFSESAMADFNAAIKEDPRYCDAYMKRGILFFNLHQPYAAIADFSHVIDLETDPLIEREAYERRAICNRAVGNRDAMNKDLEADRLLRFQIHDEVGETQVNGDEQDTIKRIRRAANDPRSQATEKRKRSLEKRLDSIVVP